MDNGYCINQQGFLYSFSKQNELIVCFQHVNRNKQQNTREVKQAKMSSQAIVIVLRLMYYFDKECVCSFPFYAFSNERR